MNAWRYGQVLTLAAIVCGPALAQDDPEADRETKVVERFVGLLEKTPRRGTALDRVYGFHVERGTLEELTTRYRDRAENGPKDGASWMVLGLIQAQRGRDAQAVAAFRHAESARPDDALASFYLGQALVLIGQPDAAVQAFERALARKPARADSMEVYQALGRVHQRARRDDEALKVWERLEKQFPEDQRVAEQIASTLAEEGQSALALPRYEKLATTARDPYRKVQFKMEAADLKVRLGKKKEAIADFECLLATLNPDSWLSKEVRRKVEDVFLRSDDQAGLASYYESWIKQHADDIDAIARRARVLAALGRAPEAREALAAAVKLAPSRRELRLALVEQLVAEKKFADAAKQYEEMAKAEPGNPDTVREWGRLLLRDPAKPEAERKQAAAAVWRKLLDARPKDAAVAAQVAELLRKAEMTDEALALYQKAVELAPDAPQYREYLGEYLHSLKRGDEALSAWGAMAAGANRRPANLARLAEVLSGFGYKAEAEKAAAETVALDPKSFEPRIKHAELLAQLDRHDEALAELDAAAPLADDAEQREAVLAAQVKVLVVGGKLTEKIDALQKELNDGDKPTADRFLRLARYFEAAQRLPDASKAMRKAIELDPASVPAHVAAARVEESSGNLGAAADAYRKLAAIDRRARTEHLTAIARLEARLGRRDEALKAGRDLLAAAPNNPEHYQTFGELCFGLGETDEGLKALRRAARLNEADPKSALTLGDALAAQFRTEEAIETYWRAFDRSPALDAKVGVVAKLAPLYLQQNQFDRLVARIERAFQEGDAQQQPREKAACLAQAHTAAGDFMAARQQLEGLLAANPRDTQLLQQLTSLAESEGDFGSAARYQKQVQDIAPGFEGATRLAQLYLRAGEPTEAENVWMALANDEAEVHRVLQALDSLAAAGKHEVVLAVTEKLLRRDPLNWDVLYREAAALQSSERFEQAAQRFRALLALRVDEDQPNLIEKARRKAVGGRPAGAAPTAAANFVYSMVPIAKRSIQNTDIRIMTGLDMRYANMYNPTGQGGRTWTPADYGQARAAASAWLLVLAQRMGTDEAFLKDVREAAEAPGADTQAIRDWYYLASVRNEPKETYAAALRMARTSPNDPQAQWAYLMSCSGRAAPSANVVSSAANRGNVDRTPPLPDDELDTIMAAFQTLRQREPVWLSSIILPVTTELKRAKRVEEEEALYREIAGKVNDSEGLSQLMNFAATRGDADGMIALADRVDHLAVPRQSATGISTSSLVFCKGMAVLASKKQHSDVLRLLDHSLDALSSPDRVARRAKASVQPVTMTGRGISVAVYNNPNTARSVAIDFPTPGVYFDQGTIQALRNAFELYRKDDLLSDLTAHLEARLKATQRDPVYERLALAYVHWWGDDKDEAIKELTSIAEATPNDADLALTIAELRANRNEPLEALALADSVNPADQKLMQRRELLALRVAVLTGNIDRARKAAERLFGLRLDANTQLQLAQQMHQLGMHELAEAVLARARRRSGNDPNALANLMLQYQRQERIDEALQVAYQIMRRSPQQSNRAYVLTGSTDAAQQQALQLLARSGKLDEQIERLEQQIERSPGSLGLYQTLAMYYTAAGKRDKVREIQAKVLALRPDDPQLRQQYAAQAYQAQDWAAAAEHYAVAIKKDPAIFGQSSSQIAQAFRMAKKQDELAALLRDLDVRAMVRGNTLVNAVFQLMNDPGSRDIALELFRKGWKAVPAQRVQLLGNMNLVNDEVLQLPEVYDYVREVVIPNPAQGEPAPWSGFDSSTITFVSSASGQVQTVFSRLIDLADRQGKLDDLAAEASDALKRWPHWNTGKVIVALSQMRQGRTDKAVKTFEELLAAKDDAVPMTSQVVLMLGQELDADPATEHLAERLYTRAMNDPAYRDNMGSFEYSLVRRQADIYKRAGKIDQARALLLRHDRAGEDRSSYDPSYAAYLQINSAQSRSTALIELGFPTDALRLVNTLLADSATLKNAEQVYGGNTDQIANRLRALSQSAMQAMEKADLDRTLRGLIGTEVTAAPYGQALDLVVLVQPRELRSAAIVSLLGRTLEAAAKGPSGLGEAKAELLRLAEEKPDDLSVRVAVALAAFAEGKADERDAALKPLVVLVEKSPLEALADGTRPNSRQREDAMKWLGVWPVARVCLKEESLRSVGETLMARAREAARRQADPLWHQAILREAGQIALDSGDTARAEKLWGELLDSVLAAPGAKASTSPTTGAVAPATPTAVGGTTAVSGTTTITSTVKAVALRPAVPAVAPPASPGAVTAVALTGQPPAAAGTTADRFTQALDVARLAADGGLPALSLRAVRDALRGGPPVTPINVMPNNATVTRIYQPGVNEPNRPGGTDQVLPALLPLERAWARSNVPPADVYAALVAIVLPESRPREAFLYTRPLATGPLSAPKSVGAMLAAWTSRANAAEDLSKRIAARLAEPMAELPLSVLTIQLALKTGDAKAANEGLNALATRLDKDSLQTTAELACHAALPALDVPECADAAEAVMSRVLKRMTAPGQNTTLAGSLAVLMSHKAFAADKAEAAIDYLKQYQATVENAPRPANVNANQDQSTVAVKQALARCAQEYVRAGRTEEALEALGKYADAPRTPNNLVEPPIASSLQRLAVLLNRLPAAERYERLRDWTLPTAGRKLVRILACEAPVISPPAVFKAEPVVAPNGLLNTSGLLIAAAKEAGRLDDLADACAKAAEANVEQADVLSALVEIARGKPERALPAIEKCLEALAKQQAEAQENVQQVRAVAAQANVPHGWPEIVLALEALRVPSLQAPARKLAEGVRRSSRSGAAQAQLDDALAEARTGSAAPADALPKGWRPVERVGEGRWVVLDDHLTRPAGRGSGDLVLATPLGGTYTVEARLRGQSTTVGVGGLLVQAGQFSQPNYDNGRPTNATRTFIQFAGPGTLAVNREFPQLSPDMAHRATIDVSPERVRYSLDGHIITEEKGRPTPWVTLRSARGGLISGLKIAGSPVIARSVKLVEEDDLRQWSAAFYGESMQARKSATPPRDMNEPYYDAPVNRVRNTQEFDWEARDGVIIGTLREREGSSFADEPWPSRLSFLRPLADDETLSYEFYYRRDFEAVHPAIGRLVFWLDADRVRLHWMTDRPEFDPTGLSIDNLADDPAMNVADGPLPLKADDWNAMRLTLRDGRVALTLNGKKIAERALEAENDRMFSFFRFKDRTSARVREVTLTGDWPDKLPASLLEPAVPPDDAARRVRAAWVGEAAFALDAPRLVAETSQLPAAERFERLADSVLPSASHASIRLHWFGSPGDDGGKFISPALEVTAAAKEAGRLDALADRVNTIEATDEAQKRSKHALVALVAGAGGRDDEARAALAELAKATLALPPERILEGRAAEIIALAGAIERRELLEAAAPLAEALKDVARRPADSPRARVPNVKMAPTPEPPPAAAKMHALRLWDERDRKARDESIQPPSSKWLASSRVTAASRGQGLPTAIWGELQGRIMHAPGHDDDRLYNAAPLTGDFEVSGRFDGLGDDQVVVQYAGIGLNIDADGKGFALSSPNGSRRESKLEQPIDSSKGPVPFRMVVKDGRCTFELESRKVVDEALRPGAPPWLVLKSSASGQGALVEFRIQGQPTVPESVLLSGPNGLTEWRGYETKGGDPLPYPWRPRNTEIVGQKLANAASAYETALFQARPLADGETISYEFRHEPGAVAAHPALDRQVFLLSSDGVKLHRLTDSGWGDDTAPDNASEASGLRAGTLPLKDRDWNRVELSVRGDKVAVKLNDVAIGELPIASSSSRQFGLFRYADSPEARVRKVTMGGPWTFAD
jgi:tetratricopeptide (TPR) repeat protein